MLHFDFLQHLETNAFLAFLLSFVVSYLALPRIIDVVKIKGLMDMPNERSSHSQKTPTLGGIAFYVSLMISLFFIRDFDLKNISIHIVAGLSILFFIGLKDDLVTVRPITKILGQVIATLILFYSVGINIISFDGFLSIYEIPAWFAVLFGCFLVLSIVNSYNLIDGINGSASMVGIVIFGCFAYIFYVVDLPYYFLVSVLCVGFLMAFLRYNLSRKKKIFMGDTGSMIVGFMIGLLALRYFSLTPYELWQADINPTSKFFVLIAIIFVPFIDTTRVFLSRIVRHGKPFKADRSHVHHVMIDYIHLSHPQASVILALVNLLAFISALIVNIFLPPVFVFLYLVALSVGAALTLFYYNRSYLVRKDKQKIRQVLNDMTGNNGKKKATSER